MDVSFRSPCAIASALDVVGDKWSLVIVRSLMQGAFTYGDLLAAPERIATNILASRLVRLERSGLVRVSAASPETKGRAGYELTPVSADLLPVLQALGAWGEAHLVDRWALPAWFKAATPQDLAKRPRWNGRGSGAGEKA